MALIDDGVDTNDAGLDGATFAGKSFDSSSWEEDRVSPYWESTCGHGTLMARLIRRICPSAVVYVIKLKGRRSTRRGAKMNIDAQSAIKVRTSFFLIPWHGGHSGSPSSSIGD